MGLWSRHVSFFSSFSFCSFHLARYSWTLQITIQITITITIKSNNNNTHLRLPRCGISVNWGERGRWGRRCGALCCCFSCSCCCCCWWRSHHIWKKHQIHIVVKERLFLRHCWLLSSASSIIFSQICVCWLLFSKGSGQKKKLLF